MDGAFGSLAINAYITGGQRPRFDVAENDIGISDRWFVATQLVARGAGHGSSTPRTYAHAAT